MSPAAARLFFVAGACLLLGGSVGIYATSLIYGEDIDAIDPNPMVGLECPPCPDCPICPPPPNCGELGPLPTSTAPTAILLPDPDDVEPRKPGLPASAIKPASAAVLDALDPCLVANEVEGLNGVLLLELTLTATGGQGFISEALVSQRTGSAASVSLEECMVRSARGAKFDWTQSEGEIKFKLPVKVGP